MNCQIHDHVYGIAVDRALSEFKLSDSCFCRLRETKSFQCPSHSLYVRNRTIQLSNHPHLIKRLSYL